MENQDDILKDSLYATGEIFIKDGIELVWSEYSGITPSDSEESRAAAEEIRSVISTFRNFYSDTESIAITPEGPFMSASEMDPVTVSYVLSLMYKDNYEVTGDLYTLKDLGLDYSSNFDEDGNPLVR